MQRSLSTLSRRAAALPSASANLRENSSWGRSLAEARPVRHFSSKQQPPSSLSGFGAGFFDQIRRQAADMITSTLPENERKELLSRYQPTDAPPNEPSLEAAAAKVATAEKASAERMKSIAEEFADYKAKEGVRMKERMESEREKILREAEEAARARVEQDLAIQQRRMAFQKWEQEVAVAREQETSMETTDVAPSVPDHPILGAVVADLGSKRIHVVPAAILANVPVWEKQRIYRHDRAKTMATDKLKTLNIGFPGVIGLFEDKDGHLSVLDGQHRIGMMKILSDKNTDDVDLERVLVEVYPVPTEADDEASLDHASDIFAEINKAEPVKKVDIFAKKGDRKILAGGVDTLQERYPDMFSPSMNCRPPHVNVDNLRDGIFASEILQTFSLKSPKALYEWLETQNDALKELYNNPEHLAKTKVNEKVLKKAVKFDFYLGLDPTYGWMYK